jgi:hypothetical protein
MKRCSNEYARALGCVEMDVSVRYRKASLCAAYRVQISRKTQKWVPLDRLKPLQTLRRESAATSLVKECLGSTTTFLGIGWSAELKGVREELVFESAERVGTNALAYLGKQSARAHRITEAVCATLSFV